MLRTTLAAGFFLAALSQISPAASESDRADWAACVKADRGIDANQRVGACNRLLQSGDTNPEDGGAILAARAAAYNDLGEHASALRDIEDALAQNTRKDAWEFIYRVMGRAQYGLGNFAAAEVAYRQATTYPEADSWSWNRLGDAAMQQGKYADAERDYRKAAELDSSRAELWSDIADSLFAQGRFAEAAQVYDKTLATTPSAWDSVMRYLSAFHHGAADADLLRRQANGWAAEESYLALAGRFLAGALAEDEFRTRMTELAANGGRAEDAAFWTAFILGHRDFIAGDKAEGRKHLAEAAAGGTRDAVYLNARQFAD